VAQPLSLWEETPAKQAVLDFVDRVTADGAETFVPPAERIATFDNDGTLWCEQPLVQGAFIAQRLAAMAKADPSPLQNPTTSTPPQTIPPSRICRLAYWAAHNGTYGRLSFEAAPRIPDPLGRTGAPDAGAV
jgi:hypothetical protein